MAHEHGINKVKEVKLHILYIKVFYLGKDSACARRHQLELQIVTLMLSAMLMEQSLDVKCIKAWCSDILQYAEEVINL